MKRTIIGSIILIGLFAPHIVHSQGTTYMSNLGQSPDGNNAVGSNSWLAAGILTGTNASGYLLNSIQLGMADATGNPTNFTAMIYSAFIGGAVLPGTNLCTLDGPANPATGGVYSFTAVSNLLLLPNTRYFIVLTAATTVANGAYEWSFINTASYNPNGGWGGGATLGSLNGSSWNPLPNYPQLDYSQFAINATAIPEPGVLGLLGLGGLAFLWHRRKF
jgi:hypothetical protein